MRMTELMRRLGHGQKGKWDTYRVAKWSRILTEYWNVTPHIWSFLGALSEVGPKPDDRINKNQTAEKLQKRSETPGFSVGKLGQH